MTMGRMRTVLTDVAYLPLRALLWTGARLPRPLAHALADVMAFMARDLVRYRRRIVRRNLRDCFPDTPETLLRRWEKEFYRFLADYFFETIALPALSADRIGERIRFSNLELLADLFSRGRDVVLYTSHYGNWEYVTTLALAMKRHYTEPVVYSHVYRPLKNRFFNRYFLGIRTRFNVSVEMRAVLRTLVGWRRDQRRFIMGFLSDQKPGHHTRPVTVDFLGRPTPFIEGTEELAHRLGCAAVYADMRRVGRGRYLVEFRLMADDASALAPGALTASYAALLTDTIRRDPPFYLWSHNRWRLNRKHPEPGA